MNTKNFYLKTEPDVTIMDGALALTMHFVSAIVSKLTKGLLLIVSLIPTTYRDVLRGKNPPHSLIDQTEVIENSSVIEVTLATQLVIRDPCGPPSPKVSLGKIQQRTGGCLLKHTLAVRAA